MEVHAELRTKTKMFCSSKNDPDERHPNVNICPICMGHPGTLPVINEEAVKHVQRVGLALGGEVQKFSQFDRKNYFYPDLPKGYQISQYKYPLVFGGELHGIRITRVHLEEDTARLGHDEKTNSSLVDFNRAGVPLMELVTEPDIRDAKTAKAFCEELQLILQYMDASYANMEKGEMRCEANISLNMGTKVEIKNLNSFRAVERAIEYEIERQKKLLENGEKIKQETRGWDENKEITFSQRKKESAHDYRYFPEPDLPPLNFNDEYIENLRGTIPELPWQKRKRLIKEYKIPVHMAEILVREKELASFWENTVSELREWMAAPGKIASSTSDIEEGAIKLAVNYFTSDLFGLIKEKEIPVSKLLVTPEDFAELIKMIDSKEINSRMAKDTLRHMVEFGGDPSDYISALGGDNPEGVKQLNDDIVLKAFCQKVINDNQNVVSDFKAGNGNAINSLIGQVMKATSGRANPELTLTLLTKLIEGV